MTPAQVIAVDTSEDALKLALHCGADHAVTADGHQAQQVRDLTGAGANAVFDFVGEDPTIGDSVAMLAPAAPTTWSATAAPSPCPPSSWSWAKSPSSGTSSAPTPTWPTSSALAAQGKVAVHSAGYPLEAANDAIGDLRHGRNRGRAILIP